MKSKSKILLGAILSVVMCASLITGATFALFTGDSKVNIAVGGGDIDVVATMSVTDVYSPTVITEDGTIVEKANAATGNTFVGGGVVDCDGKNITITNMAAGDSVTAIIAIENNSTIHSKYRTVIYPVGDTGLASVLNISINGVNYRGKKIASAWSELKVGEKVDSVEVIISMPASSDTAPQGKEVKLSFAVEAVQNNAYTSDPLSTAQADALLTANEQHVVLDLVQDLVISTSDSILWGGENTETITINGNGNVLTLDNDNDGYYAAWLQAKNPNAKIIINDAIIETVVDVRGDWNIHDITFRTNTELNNVNFSQAVAFNAIGKSVALNEVHVDEDIDGLYAMWIVAGTNVAMDNCSVVGSGVGARAIKISDQYVQEPVAITNLTVSNTIFASEKKSAILVGSTVGANITLNNVDIAGVVADDVFAVWVDSDYKASMNLVNVTGGEMRWEDDLVIATAQDMVDFEKSVNVDGKTYSGATVYMVNDVDLAGINWTPIGQTGETEFSGTFDGRENTIYNLTIDTTKDEAQLSNSQFATGLFGWDSGLIKNLNVNGANVAGVRRVGVIVGYLQFGGMENCHVTGAEVLGLHTGEGNNNDTCGDKVGGIVGFMNTNVTMTNCTISATEILAGRDAGKIVGCVAGAQSNEHAKSVLVNCTASADVTVARNEGDGCQGGRTPDHDTIGRITLA